MPREEGGVVRRLILVLASIGVAVLLASGAALGITGGTEDGNGHPYVGALVDKFDGETYPYCTGTLISPKVLLTAAHCYPETSRYFGVTFDAEYTASSPLYRGTFHEHPTLDIAVVKFNQDIPGIEPAQLPTIGKLANSAKGDRFTAVGYGATSGSSDDYGVRRYAVSTFKSVNNTYLRLSQHRGSGGTCYGDSGGPNFFGTPEEDTNVIAGITITGDTWCKATNVTLRLDTQSVHAFLDDFVELP
jgi:secreted trypsin-like serine protease